MASSYYYEQWSGLGKACIWVGLGLSWVSCHSRDPNTLRVLLDRGPTTLNPRLSADLNGQRLGELLFAALTTKDSEMRAKPGMAQRWDVLDRGLKWVFYLRPGLKDHSGKEITAERLLSCIDEYRFGKPRSIQMAASPTLKSVEAVAAKTPGEGGRLIFHLDRPDPYLATNLTLWRYFTAGDPSKPCREPQPGDTIVGSGEYRLPDFRFSDLTPEHALKLVPVSARGPALQFSWTYDDNTKALELIRGDVDVLPNSISLSKTRWLEKNYGDRFRVIERENGVNVSYLAFNLRNPLLKRLEVRKAISLAINREEFVRYKLYGFGTVASSLLSPVLPESSPQNFSYDPALAEKILDDAGFRRDSQGVRMRFRFKTTPVRDGFETTLALQQALRRIGIEVSLEVVEPAVFFASIRKGAFDLYTSRWIGLSDASIFQRVLKTGNPDNRGGYSNPEVDALLEQAQGESDDAKRRAIYSKIQAKIAEDLPFFPLWYWNSAAVLRKDLTGLEASDLSLSGSLAPLARLR